MYFVKRNIFFVIIFFVHLKSYSQSGTIKGIAIDKDSKKAIEFASVTILSAIDSSLVKGELTDSTGYFELNGLKEGKYILAISSIEYQKVFRGPLVIDLEQKTVDLENLQMITDAKALAEVVVRGSKPIIERKAGSIVMNMDNKFFKTSTNALDVLKKAPGLQIKTDGSILMRNSVSPKVFIDGKDVPMSDTELQNYLNNLRPEQIESIEIITNPSAKYDAQYKGIIDIRLKRDSNLGLSGSISTRYEQNLYASFYNNLNVTLKSQNVVYVAKVGYTDYGSIYEFNNEQKVKSGTISTNTRIPSFGNEFSGQFGVDYSLSKKQTIGILLKALKRDYIQYAKSTTLHDNIDLNGLQQNTDINPIKNIKSIGLNYEGVFKNGRLNFASTYAKYENSEKQDVKNYVENTFQSNWIADLNNSIIIKTAQVDYSTAFAKGKLELGSKLSFVTTNNDLKYDSLVNGKKFKDFLRSNEFVYDENVLAGYANFSKELKRISYKLGLRTERTNTIANSITLNQITKNNYVKVLPSFGLSYLLNEDQTISFDYSRRLKRPRFEELNPFRFYISPISYAEGNPFLLPAISTLLATNYNYKDFSVSFNYGIEEKSISQLPFFDVETNITTFLRRNLDTYHYYGFDFGYPISINKVWKMQHNLSLYNEQSKMTYYDKLYSRDVLSLYFSGSQVFSLPKKYVFDISYEYNSAQGSALYRSGEYYVVNLGLQKVFLGKKLNVQLNFNDIFYSAWSKVSFLATDIQDFTTYQKRGSRKFVLQLAYNFGKSTYKAKQKNNISAEEESRAKK